MINNAKILFLLVNYFNEKEVCTFINNQLQLNEHKFIDVVIIDNRSKEPDLLNDIKNKFSNITLLNSGNNLGYFGAANFGLTHYLSQQKEYPKAIIICNTDIKLQAGFFSVLQNKLATQNFDLLGPSIYSTFLKHHQNPYILNRISKNKLQFLHFISSTYISYTLFTIYHLLKTKLTGNKNTSASESSNPYAIHGSFMIFNKTFFEKGGTINYPSILFGEEIFIAEQTLQLNLKILYEPALQLEHNEDRKSVV